MKVHRAATLVVMMLLAVLTLGILMITAVANFNGRSLVALGVVVVLAAAGGIGFSWKGYSRPWVSRTCCGSGTRLRPNSSRREGFSTLRSRPNATASTACS